jgi:CTP synthase (UTP-ammonia lyase)
MAHIGIIGDLNPDSETHIATDQCLELAASRLELDIRAEWIPTNAILKTDLDSFDAFIVNTGVYEDRDSVLCALRMTRESKIPTLAACGGFQHMIIEYARNVLNLRDVGHAEFDSDSTAHIIVPLQCSLRGQEGDISVLRSSQVGRLYQIEKTTEKFYCSFGINQKYLEALEQSPLRVVGTDEHGLVRITELSDHPFFIGTLFVPHARALRGESHPLIDGLVEWASKR